MGSFLTVADLQHSQWQANRPGLFRGRRAGAEIGGEIIGRRRGAADCGEYRQDWGGSGSLSGGQNEALDGGQYREVAIAKAGSSGGVNFPVLSHRGFV